MMVGVALSAGLLLTNCVKNEEADGVKALREAQAELISAKAGAATSAAADATTLANATAAIDLATAAYKEAEAAKLVLENELLAAQNELDAAKIQLQIDQLEAQSEIALNTAIAEANTLLAEQQEKLASALQTLATTEAAKQGEYYDNYVDALEDLEEAQLDVYNDKVDIANATYYLGSLSSTGAFTSSDDEDDFISYITNEKYIADTKVERLEAWLATAKTIIETANQDNEEAIASAQVAYSTAEDAVEALEIEAEELEGQYQVAYTEMDVAYDNYNDALEAYDDASWFSGEESGMREIDGFFLEEIKNDPSWDGSYSGIAYDEITENDDFSGEGDYYSLGYYDILIEEAEDNSDANAVALAKVKELYDVYIDDLETLYATWETESAKLPDLLHAKNVAEMAAESYPDNTTYADELDAATDAYDDQATVVSEAWTAYTDFVADIESATIEDFTGYYSYIGDAVDGITESGQNILDIEAWLVYYEDSMTDYDADIEQYELEKAYVEVYIAYLETVKFGTESGVEDYADAYFTAKEAWDAAQEAWFAVQDELTIAEEVEEQAEDLLEVLNNEDVDSITDMLEDLEEGILDDLTDAQEDSAAYEVSLTNASYILEYLNQKLANDEAIVVEAEAIVADTLEALNAELGVEAGE